MTHKIAESELIINPDGSIYHLKLKPGDIAHDIITVGDPDRVDKVAKHFERVDINISKREFKTVTGWIGNKRLTVISTGIGTDNIDIVFTELDALVNIDFETRLRKEKHTTLRFYRIGTSGSLYADLDIDMILISSMSIGLDGLMHFYDIEYTDREQELNTKVKKALTGLPNVIPYSTEASPELVKLFSPLGMQGITVTATGFYGPQGRSVIAVPKSAHFLDDLAAIQLSDGLRVTNLEMETAGMYGLANILGHHAISINAILANRVHQKFSNRPKELVANLIKKVLHIMTS
ncbi:MAG: nucleoside phosphorylase [Saprospiraceae bacterium]|nr:nucleoside phosphorylase [Saprospiraceae bacterium]